jgi:hypothetical protein
MSTYYTIDPNSSIVRGPTFCYTSKRHIKMGMNPQPWLLLLFCLPAKNASQRVDVWRRLKRYGAISLRGSGYLLPKTELNEERFQWIAAEIGKHKGEASVLEVLRVNSMHLSDLIREFNDARTQE